MSLARFSIVVATDAGSGIAKDGFPPWTSNADTKFFRDITIGSGKNVVIMGRVTYESIPPKHRPLEGRRCVVISRSWNQEDHPEVLTYPSLLEALIGLGGNIRLYDDVFICGGEQIYSEAVRDYMYLCNKVYITKFKTDYDCDQAFPLEVFRECPQAREPSKMRDYTRYTYLPHEYHPEYQYLDLMKKISEEGEIISDNTGVGSHSLFGVSLKYDISERIPLFTTRQLNCDSIVKELLFVISGKTDSKILESQGVKTWKNLTTKEALDKRSLDSYLEGDMGPLYGYQWRHWGASYPGCKEDYSKIGVDQLQVLIKAIREEPHGSKLVLTAWNPEQVDAAAVVPSHILCQFSVSANRKFLDCCLYQRSADLFLEVPNVIASYSILTYMIAHITNLRPRCLTHMMGTAKVLSNHDTLIKRQLSRTPRPLPHLKFRRATKLNEIDDFVFDDFVFEGCTSWPRIRIEKSMD